MLRRAPSPQDLAIRRFGKFCEVPLCRNGLVSLIDGPVDKLTHSQCGPKVRSDSCSSQKRGMLYADAGVEQTKEENCTEGPPSSTPPKGGSSNGQSSKQLNPRQRSPLTARGKDRQHRCLEKSSTLQQQVGPSFGGTTQEPCFAKQARCR